MNNIAIGWVKWNHHTLFKGRRATERKREEEERESEQGIQEGDRRRIVSFGLSNRWYEKWFLIKFVYVITLGRTYSTLSSIIIHYHKQRSFFFRSSFRNCRWFHFITKCIGVSWISWFQINNQFRILCSMLSPALELSFISSLLVSRQRFSF